MNSQSNQRGMAIISALLIAAGIERFSAHLDISLVVAGYAIMRVAMIALWLRAAWHDPARRTCATSRARSRPNGRWRWRRPAVTTS